MKTAFNVLSLATVVAFFTSLVAGFTVDISHPDSSVNCGAPLEVIDGDFAAGVPEAVKADCRD